MHHHHLRNNLPPLQGGEGVARRAGGEEIASYRLLNTGYCLLLTIPTPLKTNSFPHCYSGMI